MYQTASFAPFYELLNGSAGFPLKDLQNTECTESPLAAAHPGPGVKLNTVQRPVSPLNLRHNLSLRNVLAAADNLPAGGIFRDELVQFFLFSPPESWNRFYHRVVVGVLLQKQPGRAQKVLDVLSNGRGSGSPQRE